MSCQEFWLFSESVYCAKTDDHWNSHTGYLLLMKNIMLGEKEILRKKEISWIFQEVLLLPLFPVWQKVQPGSRNVLISVKCLNPSNQHAFRKEVLGSSICNRDKVSAATSLPTRFPSAINLFQLRTGRTKDLHCRAGGNTGIVLHTEIQNKRSTFTYEALETARQYEKAWKTQTWLAFNHTGRNRWKYESSSMGMAGQHI